MLNRFSEHLPPIDVQKRGLYFLHIPKTAGTSVRYWLQDLFPHNGWLGCHVLEEIQKLDLNTVRQAPLLSGHFGTRILDLLDQPRPILTWLRHPVKRVISNYVFNRKCYDELVAIALENGRPEWVDYYNQSIAMPLPELVQSEIYIGFSDNLQTRYLSGIFPSDDPIEVTNEILQAAKQRLAQLDFVGICEWMDASIDLLSYQLQIPYRPLNMQHNSSGEDGQASRLDLTPAEWAIIEQIERFDLELYRYAQGLFTERFEKFWQLLRQSRSNTEPVTERHLRDFRRHVPAAVVRQVVDAHFQSTSQSKSTLLEGRIDFNDPAAICGWHSRFVDAQGRVLRWSGPTHRSRIFMPWRADHDYIVQFTIRVLADYKYLQSLKILVSGEPLMFKSHVLPKEHDRPREVEIEFRVPSRLVAALGPWTEIEFCVAEPLFLSRLPPRILVSFATDGFDFQAIPAAWETPPVCVPCCAATPSELGIVECVTVAAAESVV